MTNEAFSWSQTTLGDIRKSPQTERGLCPLAVRLAKRSCNKMERSCQDCEHDTMTNMEIKMERGEATGLTFVRSQIALGRVRKSVKLVEPQGSRGSE